MLVGDLLFVFVIRLDTSLSSLQIKKYAEHYCYIWIGSTSHEYLHKICFPLTNQREIKIRPVAEGVHSFLIVEYQQLFSLIKLNTDISDQALVRDFSTSTQVRNNWWPPSSKLRGKYTHTYTRVDVMPLLNALQLQICKKRRETWINEWCWRANRMSTPGRRSKLSSIIVSSSCSFRGVVPYDNTVTEIGSAMPIAYEIWKQLNG